MGAHWRDEVHSRKGENIMLTRKNAFATWLFVAITIGIYALVMFERLNRELAVTTGLPRTASTRWWSQLVPILGIVGIHGTAKRINTTAGVKVISPTAAWLWWGWFILGPYAYLQIGANRGARRLSRSAETA